MVPIDYMTFIHTKKRTNKNSNEYTYAYLVQNKWRKKGPKQTVKQYLGRVYTYQRKKDKNLRDFLNIKHIKEYFKENKTKNIILDIIRLELFKHNFKQIKENIWNNQNFFVDLENLKVYNANKKKICLAINEGILTDYTLNKIINSKHKKDNEIETGKVLANKFISAGISIEKEIFINLVQKIQNQ